MGLLGAVCHMHVSCDASANAFMGPVRRAQASACKTLAKQTKVERDRRASVAAAVVALCTANESLIITHHRCQSLCSRAHAVKQQSRTALAVQHKQK